MGLIRRLSTTLTRYRKRRLSVWLLRWQAANRRCWRILDGSPKTPVRLARFKRHHSKLMTLVKQRVGSCDD